ncbi:unnamed protein product [Sphagnum tenellum]
MNKKLRISVHASTPEEGQAWIAQMEDAIATHYSFQIKVAFKDNNKDAHILFVDSRLGTLQHELKSAQKRRLNSKTSRQAVFLVVKEEEGPQSEPSFVLELLKAGEIDGVILLPLRKLDILMCLRLYDQLVSWQEVSHLNSSFSETLTLLVEDLKLAERLQKGRLPQRFKGIKNFKAVSRYLAGTSSGGDYFDLAETQDGTTLSLLLSSASSYGLSSSVLAIFMKVALKLSQKVGGAAPPSELVKLVYEELLLVLGEKDHLSLFYATLSRSDLVLRYVHLGNSRIYYAPPNGKFSELVSQATAISHASPLSRSLNSPGLLSETVLQLAVGGRLVLISRGLEESSGGSSAVEESLNSLRSEAVLDSLNELIYKTKSSISSEIGMPEHDCSAVLLDIEVQDSLQSPKSGTEPSQPPRPARRLKVVGN